MMNLSYERVSTIQQDERRQEISLEPYNIQKRYIDKLSGKDVDRPELNRILQEARLGDHIYVESISRLGRNVDDLRQLTEQFKAAGIVIHFVKEGFDTSGAMYKFMLTILGAVAEMEREIIVERVREGIEKARRHGTRSGKPIGHPVATLPANFEKQYLLWKDGIISGVDFARYLQVGRSTLYRWIRMRETQG